MKHVKQCLDDNLSGLYVTEGRHRAMMREIVTGGGKGKRKISAAMVLFAALLIVAAAATAAAVLNSLLERTIDMEMEHGPLRTWSLEEKAELIDLLAENGWSFSEKDLDDLRSERIAASERERLATRMIVDMFGREDAVSHMDIIESVKGPMSTWSLEDKAWYSDYIRSKQARLDTWRDVLPGEGDLTREEAVDIAREAILEAHAIGRDALEGRIVNVSFFTNDGHDEPRWLISWQTDPYAASAYAVLLTRAGEIVEDEALEIDTPAHVADRMARDEADENPPYPLGHEARWSLEDKAKWLGPEHGMPADGEIAEETAADIARRTLQNRGIDTRQYEMSVWYKLYDAYAADALVQSPHYVVYFTDDLDAPREVYSVIIDPQTGEALRVYAPNHHPGNG